MFRALLEIVITIIVAMAARAILGSLMKGFKNASQNGFSEAASRQESPRRDSEPAAKGSGKAAGELHKDPVCGTYVAESTGFKRGAGRETFYYCSAACKDKHALATRS